MTSQEFTKPYEELLELVFDDLLNLLVRTDRVETFATFEKIVAQCKQNAISKHVKSSNGFTHYIKGTPEEILAKFGNVLTEEQKQEVVKYIKQP